jgi:hypothetical protein
LLLERISLAGIARAAQVSESWLGTREHFVTRGKVANFEAF